MVMTEIKALVLVFIGMIVLANTTGFALVATGASGTAFGLALGLLAVLGGIVSSLVVMHYAPPEHRRR